MTVLRCVPSHSQKDLIDLDSIPPDSYPPQPAFPPSPTAGARFGRGKQAAEAEASERAMAQALLEVDQATASLRHSRDRPFGVFCAFGRGRSNVGREKVSPI